MSPLVTAALVSSTAVDALVVALVLFRRPREPLGLARVWRAFFFAVIVFSLKAGILTSWVGSFFFLINLAYTDVFVLLPAVGIAVLGAARRREVTRTVRALAWCALALAPVGAYATFVEPERLVTEEVAVPLDASRGLAEPLRVAVLADIQSCEVTDRLRDAVRLAMEFEPHLILLPGDLMQCEGVPARERAIPEFRELLAPLEAPLGAWFVLGNTDRERTVLRVLEGTNVRLLRNEIRDFEHAGRRLLLAGADFGERSFEFVSSLRRANGDEILILFAHYPDVVRWLAPDADLDLVVAGHTHGGQVVLPFIGPPITLSSVPRRVAAGGLHELDGARIYVSRGVGAERASAPLVRFNCPPEVSLLTLR